MLGASKLPLCEPILRCRPRCRLSSSNEDLSVHFPAQLSRVLLTGASGFIGRQALSILSRSGHEVHAVARRAPSSKVDAEVSWHEVDLLDGRATSDLISRLRPECLLHLAWYAEHGRFWTSPENVRWVEASLALLRAFVSAGGRRAVLAGTCAEYDWGALGEAPGDGKPLPRCEEYGTPLAPHTLYGASKHAVRIVAERYAELQAIELAWGRVFFLYGPGEQPARLVPAVVRSLLSGADTPTSDGLQLRDFMHVEDVAAAFVALLESEVTGSVNVASGEPVTVRSVVERIASITGRAALVRWGALDRPAGDPPVLLADVARLHEEVGFSPSIDLEAGLQATVASWREALGA
jgi:nucleoside-diphosphate-sugar epimerase